MRKLLGTIAIGGALAFAAPSTAEAQGPVVTGGLVNITVTNLLNNNDILNNVNLSVAAAVQIAANVCGVAVGVIAQDLIDGEATCSSATRSVIITDQRQ